MQIFLTQATFDLETINAPQHFDRLGVTVKGKRIELFVCRITNCGVEVQQFTTTTVKNGQ